MSSAAQSIPQNFSPHPWQRVNPFYEPEAQSSAKKHTSNLSYWFQRIIGQKVQEEEMPNPIRESSFEKKRFHLLPVMVENVIGMLFHELLKFDLNITKYWTKRSDDTSIDERVHKVFHDIARVSPRKGLMYSIRYVNSSAINAFAICGGKVYVNRGLITMLLKNNKAYNLADGLQDLTFEDKLAAILGHEIAHTAYSHWSKSVIVSLVTMAVVAALQVLLPSFICRIFNIKRAVLVEDVIELIGSWTNAIFSRFFEYDADRMGTYLAAKAGYNPKGAIWAQHMLLQQAEDRVEGDKRNWTEYIYDLGRSHPPCEKRLKRNRKTVTEIQNLPFHREMKEINVVKERQDLPLHQGKKKKPTQPIRRGPRHRIRTSLRSGT